MRGKIRDQSQYPRNLDSAFSRFHCAHHSVLWFVLILNTIVSKLLSICVPRFQVFHTEWSEMGGVEAGKFITDRICMKLGFVALVDPLTVRDNGNLC